MANVYPSYLYGVLHLTLCDTQAVLPLINVSNIKKFMKVFTDPQQALSYYDKLSSFGPKIYHYTQDHSYNHKFDKAILVFEHNVFEDITIHTGEEGVYLLSPKHDYDHMFVGFGDKLKGWDMDKPLPQQKSYTKIPTNLQLIFENFIGDGRMDEYSMLLGLVVQDKMKLPICIYTFLSRWNDRQKNMKKNGYPISVEDRYVDGKLKFSASYLDGRIFTIDKSCDIQVSYGDSCDNKIPTTKDIEDDVDHHSLSHRLRPTQDGNIVKNISSIDTLETLETGGYCNRFIIKR